MTPSDQPESTAVSQNPVPPDQWGDKYDEAAQATDPNHPANTDAQPDKPLGWARGLWERVAGIGEGAGLLVKGAVGFFTTPLRAVMAPQAPEGARMSNPILDGFLAGLPADASARESARQAQEDRIHAALRARGRGEETPSEVLKNTAKGMVTMGYDLTQAVQNAETPREKYRAMTALLGTLGLMAHGAMSERAVAEVKSGPPPAPAAEIVPKQLETGQWTVEHTGFRGTSGTTHPLEPGVGGATIMSGDKAVAEGYATQGGRTEGTVSPLSMKFKNPLTLKNFQDPMFETKDLAEVIAAAKDAGHDGLIIEKGHGGHPEYMAFDQNAVTVTPHAPTPADIAARPKGFTFDPRKGEFVEKGGTVVAGVPGSKLTTVTGEVTPADIQTAMEKNKALLQQPGMMLGGWKDAEGVTHLEVSQVADHETAVKLGQQRGEQAVHNLDTGEQVATTPEKITAAAVKINGKDYTGTDHGEAYRKAGIRPGVDPHVDAIEGYVTTTGRFLNRKEGAAFGKANGQIPGETAQHGADSMDIPDLNKPEPTPVATEEPKAPVFETQQEAVDYAQTVMEGIRVTRNTDPTLTPDIVQRYKDAAAVLLDPTNPEAIKRLQDGSHFNLPSFTDESSLRAHIEALSDVIGKELDKAGRTDGVSVEQTIAEVNSLIGGLTEEQLHAFFTDPKNGFARSKVKPETLTLAANFFFKDLASQISKLSDVITVRPFDDTALHITEQMLQRYFDMGEMVLKHDSDHGRALRIMRERDNPLLTAKPGENARATERAAAVEEASAALEEVKKAKEPAPSKGDNVGSKPNDTGTIGTATLEGSAVNASEVLRARAYKRAQAALERLNKGEQTPVQGPVTPRNAAGAEQRSRDIQSAAEADPLPKQESSPKGPSDNPLGDLATLLDTAQKDLERAVEKAKKAQEPKKPVLGKSTQRTRQAASESPIDHHLVDAADAQKNAPAQKVAGMTRVQIISAANKIRMAGGNPNALAAVVKGTAVAKVMKSQPLGFRVFYNFLLSGPSTWATVVSSGHFLALNDAAAVVLGGAMHGDAGAMRLGADRLYGIYSEALDNVKGARAALNAGHSLADPVAHPPTYQVGGITGAINRVIAAPSSIVGAGDEFTRLTGYRSIIRAKSLAEGRTLGLKGNALAAKVRQDLLDSVDQKTGALLVPEAMRQAEEATLSGPLGKGTFGQKAQDLLHSNTITKTMAPFVKVGVHSFRRVWKSTPLLNRLNAETRAVLNGERGPEAMQEAHGRMVIASSLYLLGLQGFLAGNIVGRGPTDPELRAVWLKDHQPYSHRLDENSPWLSYNRMDPLGSYLGLVADAGTFVSEVGDERTADATDYGFAVVSSIFSNLNSKLYSRGITDWTEAFTAKDKHAVARAMQNLAASATIPQAVSSLNDDDVKREVHGLLDAALARLPGYSKELPASRDWSGEPIMRAPGLVNRNFNPMREQPSTNSLVESELLNLNKSLPRYPTSLGPSANLLAAEFADPKTGKTAYEQIMDLVSHPHNHKPSLRDAVEAKIKTPEYQNASSGSSAYPGGVRWKMIAAIKNAYEQEALHEFMGRPENKALLDAWINEKKLRGASLSGDASGLPEDYQQMFR